MKTKTQLAVLAALLASGLAVLAMGPFGDRMVKELGLTPDQAQKIESLKVEHQKEMITLKSQMRLKRLDLRQEMEKDSPNPASLDKMVDESAAMRATMEKARLHHLLDVKKILTPEQWQKAKAHFAERIGDMGGPGQGGRERHGKRGGHAGCPGGVPGPGGMGAGPHGAPADDDEGL